MVYGLPLLSPVGHYQSTSESIPPQISHLSNSQLLNFSFFNDLKSQIVINVDYIKTCKPPGLFFFANDNRHEVRFQAPSFENTLVSLGRRVKQYNQNQIENTLVIFKHLAKKPVCINTIF